MKRVATAAVLIPLVLIAVFRAPIWLFSILVGIVALMATKEYLDIISGFDIKPIRSVAYLFCVLTFFLYALAWRRDIRLEFLLTASVFLFIMLVFFLLGMRQADLRKATLSLALSFFAYPYITLTLLSLVTIRSALAGWFFVMFVFFAVWVGDTAAYYVGRSLGRHRLAPAISPKKTWEGAIASVLFSAIAVVIWTRFASHFAHFATAEYSDNVLHLALNMKLWAAAVCGIIINVAAQLGDLAESMIKRAAGVKDSGTILPGHGGILDRIDALLFAAPVAMWVFNVLGKYIPAP